MRPEWRRGAGGVAQTGSRPRQGGSAHRRRAGFPGPAEPGPQGDTCWGRSPAPRPRPRRGPGPPRAGGCWAPGPAASAAPPPPRLRLCRPHCWSGGPPPQARLEEQWARGSEATAERDIVRDPAPVHLGGLQTPGLWGGGRGGPSICKLREQLFPKSTPSSTRAPHPAPSAAPVPTGRCLSVRPGSSRS